MSKGQLMDDECRENKPLILPTDKPKSKNKLNLYTICCRWSRIFFVLTACLIISAFVLLWSDEEYNLKFYDYKFTSLSPSFIGYNANGSVNKKLRPRVDKTTQSSVLSVTQRPQSTSSNLTKYEKYMLTNVGGGACGGVGNMIFRMASLYGIGKELHRNPCLQGSCSEEYHIEMYSMFPNLQRFPLLKNCWTHESKGVGFAGNCWNYDNISRLHEYDNETFINLHTSYLQSHKFFHWIRAEILYMFEFSDSMKGLVDDYAKQMFDEDNAATVCAHIRQGDFTGGHPLLPSTEVFTLSGLNYLLANVMLNLTTDNVGVLLFSDDIGFANNIARQIKELNITSKAYVTQQLNRLENMALAARHCDYFLITSSGSTFGWWMAYLMPDEKQENVFYNALFFKKGNEGSAKAFREEDFFPPKWQRMVLDPEHNEMSTQDRSIPAVTV